MVSFDMSRVFNCSNSEIRLSKNPLLLKFRDQALKEPFGTFGLLNF